jgi:hypothetical protein
LAFALKTKKSKSQRAAPPHETKSPPGKNNPKLFKHNKPYKTAPRIPARPKLSVIRVIMLNSHTANPCIPPLHSYVVPSPLPWGVGAYGVCFIGGLAPKPLPAKLKNNKRQQS